jgi:hypothetical protein
MIGSFHTAGNGSLHRPLGHNELGSDSKSDDNDASSSENSTSQMSFACLSKKEKLFEMREAKQDALVGNENVASNSADDASSPQSPKSPTSVLDIMDASSVVAVTSVSSSLPDKSEGGGYRHLPNASLSGEISRISNVVELQNANAISTPRVDDKERESMPSQWLHSTEGNLIVQIASPSSLSAPRDGGIRKSKSFGVLRCNTLDPEMPHLPTRKDNLSESKTPARPLAQTKDRTIRKTESLSNLRNDKPSSARRQGEEGLQVSSPSPSGRRRKNSGMKKSASSRGLKTRGCAADDLAGSANESNLAQSQRSHKQRRDARMMKSKSMRALGTADAAPDEVPAPDVQSSCLQDSRQRNSVRNGKLRRSAVAPSEGRRHSGMRKAKSVRGLRSIEGAEPALEPLRDHCYTRQGMVGEIPVHSSQLSSLQDLQQNNGERNHKLRTSVIAQSGSRRDHGMRRAKSVRGLRSIEGAEPALELLHKHCSEARGWLNEIPVHSSQPSSLQDLQQNNSECNHKLRTSVTAQSGSRRDHGMRRSKSVRGLRSIEGAEQAVEPLHGHCGEARGWLNEIPVHSSQPSSLQDLQQNISEHNHKLRTSVNAQSGSRRDHGMRKTKSVRGLRSIEGVECTLELLHDHCSDRQGWQRLDPMMNLVSLETDHVAVSNASDYPVPPARLPLSSKGKRPDGMRKCRSMRSLKASGDRSASSSALKDMCSERLSSYRLRATDTKSMATCGHDKRLRKKNLKSKRFDLTKESASSTSTKRDGRNECSVISGDASRTTPSGSSAMRRIRSKSMNMITKDGEALFEGNIPLASSEGVPENKGRSRSGAMNRDYTKMDANDLSASPESVPEIKFVPKMRRFRTNSKIKDDAEVTTIGNESTKTGVVDRSRKGSTDPFHGSGSTDPNTRAKMDLGTVRRPSFRATQMSPASNSNGVQKRNKHSLKGLKDVRNRLGQSHHSTQMLSTKGSNQSIASHSHGSISSLTVSSRHFTQDDLSISSSQRSKLRRAFSSPRLCAAADQSLDDDTETSHHDQLEPLVTSRWQSLPQRRTSAHSMNIASDQDVSVVGLLPSTSSAGTVERWSSSTKTCRSSIRKRLEADSIPVRPNQDTSSYCGSVAQPWRESVIQVPNTPSYSIHSNSGMISELTPGTCMRDFSLSSRDCKTPPQTKFRRDDQNRKFNSLMSTLSDFLVHADVDIAKPGKKKKDGAPKMVRRHSYDSLSHASVTRNDDQESFQHPAVQSLLSGENDNAPKLPSRRTSLGGSVYSRQS